MALKRPSVSSGAPTLSEPRLDQPSTTGTPLAPLFLPGATPDGPPDAVLPRLTPHVVMRCSRGPFAGRFLYVTKDGKGEVFGGSRGQKEMTMYVERAGLSPVHARVLEEKGTARKREDALVIVDLHSESGTWQRLRWDRPLPVLCGRRSPFSCSSDSSEDDPGELDKPLGKLPCLPFVSCSARPPTPSSLLSTEGEPGLCSLDEADQEQAKGYPPRQRFLQIGDRLLRLERGDPLTPLAAFDEFLLAFELVHLKARILANLRRKGCTCEASAPGLFYRSDTTLEGVWCDEGGRARGARVEGGSEEDQAIVEEGPRAGSKSARAGERQDTSVTSRGQEKASWVSSSERPESSLTSRPANRRACSACAHTPRSERLSSRVRASARSLSSSSASSALSSSPVRPPFASPRFRLPVPSASACAAGSVAPTPPCALLSPLTAWCGKFMCSQPETVASQSVWHQEKVSEQPKFYSLFHSMSSSRRSSPRCAALRARHPLSHHSAWCKDSRYPSSASEALRRSVPRSPPVGPSRYLPILSGEPDVVSSPDLPPRPSLSSGPAFGARFCLRCEANPLEWIVRAGGSSLLLAEEPGASPRGQKPETETRSCPLSARGSSSASSPLRKATPEIRVVVSSPVFSPSSSSSTLETASPCRAGSSARSCPAVDFPCEPGSPAYCTSSRSLHSEQEPPPLDAEDSLKWRLACAELPLHYLPVSEKSCPLLIFDHESGKRLGEVRWVGAYLVPEELAASETEESTPIEKLEDGPRTSSLPCREEASAGTARVKRAEAMGGAGVNEVSDTRTQAVHIASGSPSTGVDGGRCSERRSTVDEPLESSVRVGSRDGASSLSEFVPGGLPESGLGVRERPTCEVTGPAPANLQIKGSLFERDSTRDASVSVSRQEARDALTVVATRTGPGTTSSRGLQTADFTNAPAFTSVSESRHGTDGTLLEAGDQGFHGCADSPDGSCQRPEESEVDGLAYIPRPLADREPCNTTNRLNLSECLELVQQPRSDLILAANLFSSEQTATAVRAFSGQTERSPGRAGTRGANRGEAEMTVAEGGVAETLPTGAAERFRPHPRSEKACSEGGMGSAHPDETVAGTRDAPTETEVRGEGAVVEEITSPQKGAEPPGRRTHGRVRVYSRSFFTFFEDMPGPQARTSIHSAGPCDGTSPGEEETSSASKVEEGSLSKPAVCLGGVSKEALSAASERTIVRTSAVGGEPGCRVDQRPQPCGKELRRAGIVGGSCEVTSATEHQGALSNPLSYTPETSLPLEEPGRLVESTAEETENTVPESLSLVTKVASSSPTAPSDSPNKADGTNGLRAVECPAGSFLQARPPIQADVRCADAAFSGEEGWGSSGTSNQVTSRQRHDQSSSPRSHSVLGLRGHSPPELGEATLCESEESRCAGDGSRGFSRSRPRTVPSPVVGSWVLPRSRSAAGETRQPSARGVSASRAGCSDKSDREESASANTNDAADAGVSSRRDEGSTDRRILTPTGSAGGGPNNGRANLVTAELLRDGKAAVSSQPYNVSRQSVAAFKSGSSSESATFSASSRKDEEGPNRGTGISDTGDRADTGGTTWRAMRASLGLPIDAGEQGRQRSQTRSGPLVITGVVPVDRTPASLTKRPLPGQREAEFGREQKEGHATTSWRKEAELQSEEAQGDNVARSQSGKLSEVGEAEGRAEGRDAVSLRDHHPPARSVAPHAEGAAQSLSSRPFLRSGVERSGLLSSRRCLSLVMTGGRASESSREPSSVPEPLLSSVFLAGPLLHSSQLECVQGGEAMAVQQPHVGAVYVPSCERGSAAVSFFSSRPGDADRPDSAAACPADVVSVSPGHGDGAARSASLFATISRYLSLGYEKSGFPSSLTRFSGSFEDDKPSPDASECSRSLFDSGCPRRGDGHAVNALDGRAAPSPGRAQHNEPVLPESRAARMVTSSPLTCTALPLGLLNRKQHSSHSSAVQTTTALSSLSSDFFSVSALHQAAQTDDQEGTRSGARVRCPGDSASVAVSTLSRAGGLEEGRAMIIGRSGRGARCGGRAWKKRESSQNGQVLMFDKRVADQGSWGIAAPEFGDAPSPGQGPVHEEQESSESVLTPTASTAGTEEEFALEDADAPSGFATSLHGAPPDPLSSDSDVRVASSGEEGGGAALRNVAQPALRYAGGHRGGAEDLPAWADPSSASISQGRNESGRVLKDRPSLKCEQEKARAQQRESVRQGGKKNQRGRRKTRGRHRLGRGSARHVFEGSGAGVGMLLHLNTRADRVESTHQAPSSLSLSTLSPSASSSRGRWSFCSLGHVDHQTQTAVGQVPVSGDGTICIGNRDGLHSATLPVGVSSPLFFFFPSSSAVPSPSASSAAAGCDSRTDLVRPRDPTCDGLLHQQTVDQRAASGRSPPITSGTPARGFSSVPAGDNCKAQESLKGGNTCLPYGGCADNDTGEASGSLFSPEAQNLSAACEPVAPEGAASGSLLDIREGRLGLRLRQKGNSLVRSASPSLLRDRVSSWTVPSPAPPLDVLKKNFQAKTQSNGLTRVPSWRGSPSCIPMAAPRNQPPDPGLVSQLKEFETAQQNRYPGSSESLAGEDSSLLMREVADLHSDSSRGFWPGTESHMVTSRQRTGPHLPGEDDVGAVCRGDHKRVTAVGHVSLLQPCVPVDVGRHSSLASQSAFSAKVRRATSWPSLDAQLLLPPPVSPRRRCRSVSVSPPLSLSCSSLSTARLAVGPGGTEGCVQVQDSARRSVCGTGNTSSLPNLEHGGGVPWRWAFQVIDVSAERSSELSCADGLMSFKQLCTGFVGGTHGGPVAEKNNAISSKCLSEQHLDQQCVRPLLPSGDGTSFAVVGARDSGRFCEVAPAVVAHTDTLLTPISPSLIAAGRGFKGKKMPGNRQTEAASIQSLRVGIPRQGRLDTERSPCACLEKGFFDTGKKESEVRPSAFCSPLHGSTGPALSGKGSGDGNTKVRERRRVLTQVVSAQNSQGWNLDRRVLTKEETCLLRSRSAEFVQNSLSGLQGSPLGSDSSRDEELLLGRAVRNRPGFRRKERLSDSEVGHKSSSGMQRRAGPDRARVRRRETAVCFPVGHKAAPATATKVCIEAEELRILRREPAEEEGAQILMKENNAEPCSGEDRGRTQGRRQQKAEGARQLSHDARSDWMCGKTGGKATTDRNDGQPSLPGGSTASLTCPPVPDEGAASSAEARASRFVCAPRQSDAKNPPRSLAGAGAVTLLSKVRRRASSLDSAVLGSPSRSFPRNRRSFCRGSLPSFSSQPSVPLSVACTPTESSTNRAILFPPTGAVPGSSRRLLSLPSSALSMKRRGKDFGIGSIIGHERAKQGELPAKNSAAFSSAIDGEGEDSGRRKGDDCVIAETGGQEESRRGCLPCEHEEERGAERSGTSSTDSGATQRNRARQPAKSEIGSLFVRRKALSNGCLPGVGIHRDAVSAGEDDQNHCIGRRSSRRRPSSSGAPLTRGRTEACMLAASCSRANSFPAFLRGSLASPPPLLADKRSVRTDALEPESAGFFGSKNNALGLSSSGPDETGPLMEPPPHSAPRCVALSCSLLASWDEGASVDQTRKGSVQVLSAVAHSSPSEESSLSPSAITPDYGSESSAPGVANRPVTSAEVAGATPAHQAAAVAAGLCGPADTCGGQWGRALANPDEVLVSGQDVSRLAGSESSAARNELLSASATVDVHAAVAARPRLLPSLKGRSPVNQKKSLHRQIRRTGSKRGENESAERASHREPPRSSIILSESSLPLSSRSSAKPTGRHRGPVALHTLSGPHSGPRSQACRSQKLVAQGMTGGARSVPSRFRDTNEEKASFEESVGDKLQKRAFADEDEDVLLYKAREYLLRHPRDDRPQIVIPHSGASRGRRELDCGQKTHSFPVSGTSDPAALQALLCTYMEGDFQLVATTRLVDSPAPSAWFRLAPGVPGRLRPGDEIRMGSLELAVLRFNTGVGSQQGFRGTMEDEEVVLQDLAVSDAFYCSFFAVHDGHGGRDCAQFVKRQLHLRFRHQLLRLCGRLELSNAVDTHVHAALAEAFLKTDAAYLASQRGLGLRTTSGCATVVVVIVGGALWTANCGDARAVLSRGGRAIQLSADHKPHRRDEMQRIVAAGGFVRCRRVLGRLAVSRAFGDSEYKGAPAGSWEGVNESSGWHWQGATRDEGVPGEGKRQLELSGKDQNRKRSGVSGHPSRLRDTLLKGQTPERGGNFLFRAPLVTAAPEIRRETLTEADEFLLLACDGLFDVFTSQEAVTFVRERLAAMPEAEQDPQIVVNELIREAIEERRSRDNVTAILVTFRSDIGCAQTG